ncbi:zinc finger protein 593 [Populus alba x Populus x berolinensis]|nr:zinc finger protein 593 [Populus alba x Populus x berolinensis]
MGGKCPSRKVKKRRYSHKTARRSKFLLKGDDAVYEELQQKPDGEMKEATLPLDEDLPGMGQYYCLHCEYVKDFFLLFNNFAALLWLLSFSFKTNLGSRYFANVSVRDEHFKTKRHKKRVKQMMGPAPHTQLDADLAAGMGAPDNGLKLMSM